MHFLPQNFFPIAIFPETALASSVITTVWVGVFVIAFFNLRFGWSLSGLIIPGYLVPLFILKPIPAVIILVEGILTYLLSYFLSEYASKVKLWGNLFGRERIFTLILSSILIKTALDGWILPVVGEYIATHYFVRFDFSNSFHSLGLIIVALIANHLWKPGLVRGLFSIAVTTAITYFLVRYVLMVYTNFHVSRLEYLYSDLAATILSSPKAYMIILVTAFVCSRMNLLYGWDFNGILIPSLIALQWYNPLKILTSFGEAILILIVGTYLLKLPIFRKATIEGARKILLFFNISYIYKFCLGYFLLTFFPDVKINDFYGFGYVLPTYIAIKMHDTGVVGRLVRTTLQTTLVAVLGASVVGFSFTLISNPAETNLKAVTQPVVIAHIDRDIVDVLRRDKLQLYTARLGNIKTPTPVELETFQSALKMLKTYLANQDPKYLDNAANELKKVRYDISIVNNRYLYMKEELPFRGWGIYVIDMKSPGEMVVEVPNPLDEWGSMESAVWLFKTMNAKELAISGAAKETTGARTVDVLRNYQTFYQAFHKAFSHQNVLQVRSYVAEARKQGEIKPGISAKQSSAAKTTLWVKSKLPPDLDLAKLKNIIEEYDVNWNKTPFNNIQRDSTHAGFTELVLSRAGVRKVLSKGIVIAEEIPLVEKEVGIEGQLEAWLLAYKQIFPEQGTNKYRTPTLEELLYFDEEIVNPLIQTIRNEFHNTGWTPQGLEELKTIGVAASAMGYELVRYKQKETDKEFILLEEKESMPKLSFWGTYVFRVKEPKEYIIEIPRPLYELNAFEYAVSLFSQTNAIALLVGGTHPFANVDFSSDIVRAANKSNLFNLVYQVLLRDLQKELVMVVQVRGFGVKQPAQAFAEDVMIALGIGFGDVKQQRVLANKFISILQKSGLSTEVVEGTATTAGYEITIAPQYQYLIATQNKIFSMLWLAPWLRSDFRQQVDNRIHLGQIKSLRIPSVSADLYTSLPVKEGVVLDPRTLSELEKDLKDYIESYDVVDLDNVIKKWSQYKFSHVVDSISGQSILIVTDANQKIALIVNLFPVQENKVFPIRTTTLTKENVLDFTVSRAAFLYFEGQK